jgi:hypothetical protein
MPGIAVAGNWTPDAEDVSDSQPFDGTSLAAG